MFFGHSTFPAALLKCGDNFLSIQAGGMSFCSEWNIIQTRIEVLNRHVAWGPFEGADENDGAPRYQARWALACGINERERERERERKRKGEQKTARGTAKGDTSEGVLHAGRARRAPGIPDFQVRAESGEPRCPERRWSLWPTTPSIIAKSYTTYLGEARKPAHVLS